MEPRPLPNWPRRTNVGCCQPQVRGAVPATGPRRRASQRSADLSDSGGDILAAKKRIVSELAKLEEEARAKGQEPGFVIHLALAHDCLLQQSHIIARETLHSLDFIYARIVCRVATQGTLLFLFVEDEGKGEG